MKPKPQEKNEKITKPRKRHWERAQQRRTGESVANEATHRWIVAKSLRPSQEICMMPTYWRQRNDLVRSTGRHIQRMQKALTQMNLQLANVLSAVSGMARDAHKVAALRDLRVKASEERIAQSLEGNWQPDLLFLLKQETQSTPRPHPPPRSAAQQREA